MAGEIGRGLTLSFYRSAELPDCTNGGISSRFSRCVLVGIVDYSTRQRVSGDPEVRPEPEWAGIVEPNEDCLPVWRMKGQAFPGTWHLIPGDPVAGTADRSTWWMLVGNLMSTSDSRPRQITDDQRWHVNAAAGETA